MSSPQQRDPYKGLRPYLEEDAIFFFGRDNDRIVVVNNLLAAPLTLLYGPTGVGKSSVLRAGVAHDVLARAESNKAKRGVPELAVAVVDNWRNDPLNEIRQRLREAIERVFPDGILDEEPKSLESALQHWSAKIGGPILVILDQFEEYFLYNHADSDQSFVAQFSRLVNSFHTRANFLISIRQDALAQLDRFKSHLPNLFDNYVRIKHLDEKAARAAIENPIEQYNQFLDPEDRIHIEPDLVDAVLDGVRTGNVVLDLTRRGLSRSLPDRERVIETPFLSMVMQRLWEEEVARGARVLHLATLERLGGAASIVHSHLDGLMKKLTPEQQRLAARVFEYLVTPSGTKIAHRVDDLAAWAHTKPTSLTPVVQRLADLRILRRASAHLEEAEVYEIYHDVLADAILGWQTRYSQEQASAEARAQLAAEQA